ncbi:ATP-binding protein [Streptomonospora salina]|uniref:Anti-sigma regulatory factor (Ser/Thr protein kinase) n=1 Tax=Streptomonospora salina TaxID=104205 RepID=A0A841E7E9_9ACTN|nr:ATP-binding protein [Streptomonospora salina]MBB5997043.1 anti-sigma regulatory factor (Ser/Thr protein kinase) [Streptomonospora salina]
MDMYSTSLPGKPENVADARNWLDGLLRCQPAGDRPVPDDTRATAVLLLSELATNALHHSRSGDGGAYNVRLCLAAGALRVEVEDDGPLGCQVPEQRAASPDDESGRGLALVAAFADAWGPCRVGRGAYFLLYWQDRTAPPLPRRRRGRSYADGNPFAPPRRADGGDARM